MSKPHDWIPLTDKVKRCARCPIIQVEIDREAEDVTYWHFDQFGQILPEIEVQEGCTRGDLTEEEPLERLMKELFP